MAFLPKRLFFQFVLLLSLILVATIVSYGWIASRKQVTVTRQVIRTNAGVVARGLAESSAHYLIIRDYASLGAFLVRVAELPNVRRITVYEPDGMVVAEAVREDDRAVEVTKPRIEALPASPVPAISEHGEELMVWHPVATYNLIGWVRLSYGLEAVTELRHAIWTFTVLLLSVWVPLGILLLSLVVRKPVNEIGRLSAFARRLSSVRGEQIGGKSPSEELSVLQTSLNTASRELHDREQQLIAEREEIRLNEERFEALYQLNRMADDPEDVIAEFALEAGVRLTRSAGGYLHFFHEDEETISLYRWSKEVLKFCAATYESHYPLASAGVWADSLRSRAPVSHNDFAALEGKK
ncbi:MAG: GAF domain-containing protein, partial [Nitrospirota bacterium]|nr:GAF domain-containing protein [Nitrospirota bacterium]